MKCSLSAVIVTVALFVPVSFATALSQPASLSVAANGFSPDGYIKPDYAFCVPAAQGHVKDGPDKNVGLSWSKGPDGTKSYAIIAVDPDVPTVFDDAGKEGRTLPVSMKRMDFYHWVLIDIPATTLAIPAGAESEGMAKNGKPIVKTTYGLRGINSYMRYMASIPDRKGVYAGYDGPCPPWNDERIHHYHFKVFALNVPTLGLKGAITGPQALKALAPHVLAYGEVVGKYTLNPEVKK